MPSAREVAPEANAAPGRAAVEGPLDDFQWSGHCPPDLARRQSTRPDETTHKEVAAMKVWGLLFFLLGLGGAVTAISLTFLLWQDKPVGLPCDVTGREGTLYTRDGFGGIREFLVNGGDSFLLAARGAHTDGPVPVETLKGVTSGSVLHVEFCGSQAVRLVSNGSEVYILTQEHAKENIARGMKSTARFAAVCFAAAIVSFFMLRLAPALHI